MIIASKDISKKLCQSICAITKSVVCVAFNLIIFGTNTRDAVDKTYHWAKWEICQFFGIDRNIWSIFPTEERLV